MPVAYSYKRFSSEKQARGDSLNRQQQLAERYIAEHPELDLVLDTSLKMSDAGLSAYKGVHLRKGDLGVFLLLVDQGQIEPGSYLLIENFDRLSRDTPTQAFRVLSDLIDAHIVVVTLNDGREYSKESMTGEESTISLLTSLLSMVRANDESRTKGKRVKAAWESKFKRISEGAQLTKRVPFWISPNLELIEERAVVVRRIYEMYANGHGSYRIARALNGEGVTPPTERAQHWAVSTVNKILKSEAVVGTLHTADGGEHRNYYPIVIAEELWHECLRLRPTAKRTAGKPGSALLSGIFVCSQCGSTVRKAIKTGRVKKDGLRTKFETMVCSKAVNNAGCVYIGLNHKKVLNATLVAIRGLEYKSPPNDLVATEIIELEDKISFMGDDLSFVFEELKRKRTVELRNRYRLIEKELESNRQQLKEMKASRGAVSHNSQVRAMEDIFNGGNITNPNLRKIIKRGEIDFIEQKIVLTTHAGVDVEEYLSGKESVAL